MSRQLARCAASALCAVLLYPAVATADGGLPDGGAPANPADWPTVTPGAVIAAYCGDAELECTVAELEYSKRVELPIAFDWDTGWIPSGSDLQVRFFLKVPAETTVELAGQLNTTWPMALTNHAIGWPRTGYVGFDFGLEVGAKAKIDISFPPVNWQGDIPFVPQVNFHLDSAKQFDSWAYSPDGQKASAFTQPLRLFAIDVLNLAGIPSAIASGGIALDLQGELAATYSTDRIRIVPVKPDGMTEPPELTKADDSNQHDFIGGAFIEYDVWPEGKVEYDGVIHLLPTFFLELVGAIDFSIPLIDIPITVPLGKQDFVFDPVRVHVPLPDLMPFDASTVIDFGEVVVGDGERKSIKLSNIGEARARAVGFLPDADAKDWKLLTPAALIDPLEQGEYDVRFTPTEPGQIETVLTFVTNDPDLRFTKVKLRGVGVGQERPEYPDAGPGTGGTGGGDAGEASATGAQQDGGCGCRTVGGSTPFAPGAGAAFVFGAALLRRRRRRHRG